MTGVELKDLARTVRRAVARLSRREDFAHGGDNAICDLDDVEQDAALHIWMTWLRTHEPVVGGRTFYVTAGRRQAIAARKQIESLTALTSYGRKQNAGVTGRTQIVGPGLQPGEAAIDVEGGDDPTAARDADDRQRAFWRLTDEMNRVRIATPVVREAARVLQLLPDPLTLDQAARASGRSRDHIQRATRKLRDAIKNSPRVQAARAIYRETLEAA